ncbi:hypothetical protein ABW21_db0202958 [Orbilia brochopaga]|nr:hypothetical protein ABW21_db0202958 [Drechslerella brochopaga]
MLMSHEQMDAQGQLGQKIRRFNSLARETVEYIKAHPQDFPVHHRIFPIFDEIGLNLNLWRLMVTITHWRNLDVHTGPEVTDFKAVADRGANLPWRRRKSEKGSAKVGGYRD